jgi:hypothetical protein
MLRGCFVGALQLSVLALELLEPLTLGRREPGPRAGIPHFRDGVRLVVPADGCCNRSGPARRRSRRAGMGGGGNSGAPPECPEEGPAVTDVPASRHGNICTDVIALKHAPQRSESGPARRA